MANIETEVAWLINEIILDSAKYRSPGHLYHELEAGGLIPEYIWGPEVDTEELRIRSSKTIAGMALKFLRDDTEMDSGFYLVIISRLREELEAGGLTLDDIGMSEAEIEDFRNISTRS